MFQGRSGHRHFGGSSDTDASISRHDARSSGRSLLLLHPGPVEGSNLGHLTKNNWTLDLYVPSTSHSLKSLSAGHTQGLYQ